jgi:hypothetical protein
MPTWKEEKERLRWLIKEGKLTDDMHVRVIMPSLDARSRMENKEKRKRFCFNCTPADYSELAAINEAYMMTLDHNPSFRTAAFIEALKTFDVKGWAEEQGHGTTEGA